MSKNMDAPNSLEQPTHTPKHKHEQTTTTTKSKRKKFFNLFQLILI